MKDIIEIVKYVKEAGLLNKGVRWCLFKKKLLKTKDGVYVINLYQ